MLKRLAIGLILVVLAAPATAQNFDQGLEALKAKDFATAFREFEPLANQGHAESQYIIGELYFSGDGVDKDPDEAIKWFQKSAAQGYRYGQYRLGMRYFMGDAVKRDLDKARLLLRKAAEQEHAGGMWALQIFSAKDKVQAYKWALLANARWGKTFAEDLLFYGIEEKTIEKIHEKFKETGLNAIRLLTEMMTPAQIAQGKKLAQEWSDKHNKR